MKKNALRIWDNATDLIARQFIDKYFGKDYGENDNYYWVGNDEDREVLVINDYFFNLNDMVTALRYGATEEQLFDYYDIMTGDKPPKISFRNYIKNGKNKTKIQNFVITDVVI